MSSSGGGGEGWRPPPTPVTQNKRPRGGLAGGGGGGGGGSSSDPCHILEIANLNSVNRTALATLRIGDQLDVVLLNGPPQRLLAETNGTTVGSITSRSLPQLILCIAKGHAYQAEVAAISGAICQVRIHPL